MKVHIVPVRLDAGQYDRLTKLCGKTGLSASEVLRAALDGVPLRERPSADMGKLYTEINRIGNNINQIARKMNAGFGTRADAREVLFLMRAVYEKVEAIAEQ